MHTAAQPKWMTIVGWILSVAPCAMLGMSATMKFIRPPAMAEQFEKFGYPGGVWTPLGIVEATCTVLFLLPPTRVLGAILLTGYLGGAIATHVRVSDPFLPPLILGVVLWLGLFFRDARLRALLPITR
ncbi:MAG: DoxX family protein [Phycisphaerales bacterium]|nr:DoxX family protein [Phycisphaerales bacterium]